MNCAKCGHPFDLHIPGTDQCNWRLDGEWRCVCDGWEPRP